MNKDSIKSLPVRRSKLINFILPSAIDSLNLTLRVLGFAALALTSHVAAAVTPNASFGSALITGADNRISVKRVPVKNSTGVISYKDVNIDFQVTDTGVLNLAPFSPTITASPALITSGFKSGNYKDSRGNKYAVTGPSVIPGTTRTAWSLVLVSGPDATQFSLSWITGPIAGHPNQSSLTARSITTTAYSWGIVGSASSNTSFPFYSWGDYGYVVGAAQAGNQLVLHLFKNLDNIEDKSVSLAFCTTVC